MALRKPVIVAAIGTTQTLAWASSYYVPAILAEPMARDIGVAPSTVFGVFSGALLMTAVLGPMVGRIIDTKGGRGILAASNLVFAAGLGLLGIADSLTGLIVAWAVLGAGMAMGLYDSAFATLTGLYGREARASITGVTLIAGFASTVGWPASAYMADTIGWQNACFVWAALHLVIGLPLNRLLIPAAPPPAPAASTAGEATPPQRGAMALLAFVFAATWFVTSAMAAHLPELLRATGAGATAAIFAGTLVGPAQVAARIFEFSLLRRFHPLASARMAAVFHPVGAGILMLVGGPAASAFALLHGAGNGLLTIAKGTLPLAIFGPVGYGLRSGLLSVPARGTQAAAPFVFGLVLERFGANVALMVSTGLCLSALAALMILRAAPKADVAPAAAE